MKVDEIKVTFQPSGRGVYVLPGTSVLEAAGRAGIILQTPCGGRGTCGKCRVRVVGAEYATRSVGHGPLPAGQVGEGFRLACATTIQKTVTVDVPEESMFESQQKILTSDTGARGAFDPVVRKAFFELKPPSSGDPCSDVERLQRAIGRAELTEECLELLPRFLRGNEWRGTAVLAKGRVVALEAGDTTRSLYGVAFDIGTTTVVGTLFDLSSGRELGVESQMNGQIAHGDDVISRIMKIREHAADLPRLQRAIVDTVNGILRRLAQGAGIPVSAIYEVVIAGNSTMQQIFCGLDPSALGEVPFVHAFDRAICVSAEKLALQVNPDAEVFVFPQIGGFVGGDTVAGMLAARLDQFEKPVLLVDIGTNGEIVLGRQGRMMATSTAAGPAFEGARITQGMRATNGAIEKVLFKDDVLLNVIGNTPPMGLCGTAVIDAVAELLRRGIVDETGRILTGDELPSGLPDRIRERVVSDEGETYFVLATADESGTDKAVCLWQRDIRELQLATGAILAGVNILLKRFGLKARDLSTVLLAGAFGNFIRRSNALRIGLLPAIPCDGIRFIGNSASMGAKLALLSQEERNYAERLRQKTEHVDLSLDPGFQDEFGAAMMFPGPEADHCHDPDSPA